MVKGEKDPLKTYPKEEISHIKRRGREGSWWQFIHFQNEVTKTEHNYLVIYLKKSMFEDMKELFELQNPLLSCSAVIREGRPFVVMDFALAGFKFAIPLNRVFESGQSLGEKLQVGEMLTVVLTANIEKRNVLTLSKKGLSLNVPIEEIIAFTFEYTEDMDELYRFYKYLLGSKRRSIIKKEMKT